jgi:hypothetical protein
VKRLAFYTFGIIKDSYYSDALKEFSGFASSVFAEAAAADGFIAHAGQARPDLRGAVDIGQDYGPWGLYAVPRFFGKSRMTEGSSGIQTLSLWRDVEAAKKFSYSGLHSAALKRRSEWFEHLRLPGYVLWWVPIDVTPTWSDGVGRLETLADKGPTASGFDFAHLHNSEGRPQSKK